MSKQDHLQFDGIVQSCEANSIFKVVLDNEHSLTCTIAGKLRKNFIRIITGDKVRVEVSPYDLNRGRIIKRYGTSSNQYSVYHKIKK